MYVITNYLLIKIFGHILFLLDSLSVSEPPWKVSQRIRHLCPAVDEASLLVPGPHQL